MTHDNGRFAILFLRRALARGWINTALVSSLLARPAPLAISVTRRAPNMRDLADLPLIQEVEEDTADVSTVIDAPVEPDEKT